MTNKMTAKVLRDPWEAAEKLLWLGFSVDTALFFDVNICIRGSAFATRHPAINVPLRALRRATFIAFEKETHE